MKHMKPLSALVTTAVFPVLLSAQCPGVLPTFRWQNVGDTTIQFLDETFSEGIQVDSQEWDFGDNSPIISGLAVTHSYYNAGLDTVRLSVYSGGCTFTTKAIVAHGGHAELCNSSIAGDYVYEQTSNNQIAFTDQSDPAGMSVVNFWAFGDGFIDFSASPTHFYVPPGAYDATHSIVTLDSAFQTACAAGRVRKLLVDGNSSTCDTSLFLNLTLFQNGQNVALSAEALLFNTDLSVVEINWNYGDGSTALVAPLNTEHYYLQGGAFQICAEVIALNTSSSQSCAAQVCESVQITALLAEVEEEDIAPLVARPIPFADHVSISGAALHRNMQWELVDLAGKILLSGSVTLEGEENIDAGAIASGLYTIRFFSANEAIALRVLKQ